MKEPYIILKENTWLERTYHMNFGWGNGYVVLPEGHKYHKVDYDKIPVNVHYGLAFGQIIDDELIAHWPELTEHDKGNYIIGFDTAHHMDTLEAWPKERVEEEANNLLSQLI